MMNEIWLFLRLWQALPGQAILRPLLLGLMREFPEGPLELWQQTARDRGWILSDPFQLLPSEVIHQARVEMDKAQSQEWHLLSPVHPMYPKKLLQGMDPPLTLMVAGSLSALHAPSLSVVGSREPHPESLVWMENELSRFCRDVRVVLVSGGARGIDQKAHSIALRQGAPTVAFLPSGLENTYPADLAHWRQEIMDGGGAMVSEYPSAQRMYKQNFHQRNRLIAAQGDGVLIVEARPRSGTMLTATRAAEIGRPLWVVPGHPLSLSHGGSLQLLAEGASLVRHHEDLMLFWQVENELTKEANLPIEVHWVRDAHM